MMRIGSRRVRSAGRASGSIEITLPPDLTPLEGVMCNILIRDGGRPEIVLQPELTPALLIFVRIWNRLHTLLGLVGEIGEFPSAEVDVCLLPPASSAHRQGGSRPTLVYTYALIVGQTFVARWPISTAEFAVRAPSPEMTETARDALFGLVQPLASIAGFRLGLSSEVATFFGGVVALLALPQSQDPTSPDVFDSLQATSDGGYEVGWSRQVWRDLCGKDAPPLGVLAMHANDKEAKMALQRIVSQFRDWQEHPRHRQAMLVEWHGQISARLTGASDSTSMH
jgi:hypothetical protein